MAINEAVVHTFERKEKRGMEVGSHGHVVEDEHCAMLMSRGKYDLMRNEELDVVEKVDYIATKDKNGVWLRHPFENQLTTRDLSLAKFQAFCRSRDRRRTATSVYTVIPCREFVEASVLGVEFLIEELDHHEYPARVVHVLDIDRKGRIHMWTADEFIDVLLKRRAEAVTKVCIVTMVKDRSIIVRQRYSPRDIIITTDEIVARNLRIAFNNHLKGISSLIGTSILVDIHRTSQHGINAKLRPCGPRVTPVHS